MGRMTRIVRGRTQLLRSALVLGALVILLLTGCNTTSGFGRDVQSLGRGIERNAVKNNR